MKILVTGAAGFIGMHVARSLLARGDDVVGVDNVNDYYDVGLKQARLRELAAHVKFSFARLDIADDSAVRALFEREEPKRVVHLAAQAGVRYSVDHPQAYVQSNLVGCANILEACRHHRVEHLVYASTSSVYGLNGRLPFSVHDNVDHPSSFYAATKKANELMAHSYSHLFRLPTTGLRFFTVYGPWGRPDMSLARFTAAILAGKPIDVYNHGNMQRDFTYIDDIVDGVVRTLDRPAQPEPAFDRMKPDPGSSEAPYRVYNIGNNNPVNLLEYIEIIESVLGRKAIKNFLPMQAGDVPATYADIEDLDRAVGFRPRTRIADGVARYVAWYRDYYGV